MLTASARLPERAKLAGAIERHADAKAVLDRIEQAIDKITADRIEDRVSISRAREALKIAATGRSEILIAAALNEDPPDLPDPDEAQVTLDAAEASLDASTHALRTLEDEAQRARSALGLTEIALARAVKAAVASDPALATLKAEYARTMARAARLWRALRAVDVAVFNVVERLGGDDAEWTAALARLREDPDAVLPGLPPDEPLDDARAGGHKRAAAA